MKHWIIVPLVVLVPLVATAQIDPDQNSIGIYFDTGATQVTATVPPPAPGGHTDIEAWVIGTRISPEAELEYWTGWVGPYPPGQPGAVPCAYIMGNVTAGYNLAEPMPGDGACSFIVHMYAGDHVMTGLTTVLAHLDVSVYCGDPVPLYALDCHMWLRNEAEVVLQPSSGSPSLPVAMINGEPPVPDSQATWGTVKALFGR